MIGAMSGLEVRADVVIEWSSGAEWDLMDMIGGEVGSYEMAKKVFKRLESKLETEIKKRIVETKSFVIGKIDLELQEEEDGMDLSLTLAKPNEIILEPSDRGIKANILI